MSQQAAITLAIAATLGLIGLSFSFGRIHTLEYGLDWNHLTQVFRHERTTFDDT
jgi:hypothetical protein